MYCVAWAPDGSRLIAVTWDGLLIQVTNNVALATVYKSTGGVRVIFYAFMVFLILSSCADARTALAGSLPSAAAKK